MHGTHKDVHLSCVCQTAGVTAMSNTGFVLSVVLSEVGVGFILIQVSKHHLVTKVILLLEHTHN